MLLHWCRYANRYLSVWTTDAYGEARGRPPRQQRSVKPSRRFGCGPTNHYGPFRVGSRLARLELPARTRGSMAPPPTPPQTDLSTVPVLGCRYSAGAHVWPELPTCAGGRQHGAVMHEAACGRFPTPVHVARVTSPPTLGPKVCPQPQLRPPIWEAAWRRCPHLPGIGHVLPGARTPSPHGCVLASVANMRPSLRSSPRGGRKGVTSGGGGSDLSTHPDSCRITSISWLTQPLQSPPAAWPPERQIPVNKFQIIYERSTATTNNCAQMFTFLASLSQSI